MRDTLTLIRIATREGWPMLAVPAVLWTYALLLECFR